jgi:hypothetical protein
MEATEIMRVWGLEIYGWWINSPMISLHWKDCPLNCMMWIDIRRRGPMMCPRAFVLINLGHAIYCASLHDYQSVLHLLPFFQRRVCVGQSCILSRMQQSRRTYSFPIRQKHMFLCNPSQFEQDKLNQLAFSSVFFPPSPVSLLVY